MREVMCTGPLPPEGSALGFCTVCTIRYKAEAVELADVQEKLQALMRGDGKTAYFDLAGAVHGRIDEPQEAASWAICPLLNNALVPLCWGHVQGIRFTPLAAPDASQVPLLAGKRAR